MLDQPLISQYMSISSKLDVVVIMFTAAQWKIDNFQENHEEIGGMNVDGDA